MSEENGMKRPLMAPRRANINGKLQNPVPIMKKNAHRRRYCCCCCCWWQYCEPFCYGLAALTILIVIIFLAALILTLFPIPLQKLKIWLKKDNQQHLTNTLNDQFIQTQKFNEPNAYGIDGKEFVPCTQITVHKVWTKIFPRLNSESPVRKADLNGDGIKDIIFGYGIGKYFFKYHFLINTYIYVFVDDNIQYEGIELPKCKSARQDKEILCEGGVIALNGLNGDLIWQRWTAANIFSIICTVDIDKDGFMDCIAAGRGGVRIT